jgi:manganese efflux pump family protein
MILHAFQRPPEKSGLERNGSPLVLLATALGTSVDAMAVGVSLSFLDVNVLVISLSIGAATFVYVDRRHAGRTTDRNVFRLLG